MKTLLLFVPSAVAIALLIWHAWSHRGRRIALSFFISGVSIWRRAGKCDSLDHRGIAGRRDALCIHAAGGADIFSVITGGNRMDLCPLCELVAG